MGQAVYDYDAIRSYSLRSFDNHGFVFVWGKWMPDEFLGMTMTTPWLYSFFYNILWAGPDLLLAAVIFFILYRLAPLQKYLLGQDLR